MEHSTCVLDISDDEGKIQSTRDGRGKENIPPLEPVSTTPNQGGPVAATVATSRKDMMTDEPRTPLGELNPKDFCPEGVDSTSCIVYEDEKSPSSKEEAVEPAPEVAQPTPTTSTTQPPLLTTATVSALIESTAPVVEAEQQQQQSALDAAAVPLPTDSEIDIWESGSATEEAATAEGNGPVESIFSP